MTTTENKVTFGLKDLVLFFENDNGAATAIDSIINYNRTMNVTTTDLYANDSLYFRLNDEKNGDGTMELAYLPKAVVARMLGWRIDSNGGLVHIKDAKPERFDMCFSVDGDQYARRKFVYGCEASMTADNNETRGENVNFRTEQATITEYGVDHQGEHVWDYTIYEADDPTNFAASKTQVVYPAAAGSDTDTDSDSDSDTISA